MKNIAACVAIIMVSCLCPPAFAQDFHDVLNRFALTPPTGWERVSDEQVKKFDEAVARRMPDRNFSYIAAYTQSPKTPFEAPYVVVQVTHVRLKGSNYDGLEKSLGSGNFQQASQETAQKLSSLIKEFQTDQPVFDKPHNRMFTQLSMTDARGRQLKAICTANFGDESIIQINCYADAAKLDALIPEFDKFNSGFRFDPGAEFHPVSSSVWSSTLQYGLIGGIAGAVVGLLSYFRKKMS